MLKDIFSDINKDASSPFNIQEDSNNKQERGAHSRMNSIDNYLPYHIKSEDDGGEDNMDFDLYAGLPMPIQDNEFDNDDIGTPI
jgi:hypothetical protein